jgi:hypothetical protein
MSTHETDAALAEIELDKLTPNPLNLRRSVGDIKALTKSIAEVGIVVPLIVTPVEGGPTCWRRVSGGWPPRTPRDWRRRRASCVS